MYLENCISNLYKRLPIWELFSFVPESPSFLTKKVGKSVLFAAGSCLSRSFQEPMFGPWDFPVVANREPPCGALTDPT